MNIQEIRKQYPQYADMTDEDLANGLHQKYYADLPFDEFAGKIGFQSQVPAQVSQVLDVGDVPSVPTPEQTQRAQTMPAPGPRSFMDKAQSYFSHLTEAARQPNVSPNLSAIGPQVDWATENPDVALATALSIAAPELAIPAQAAARLGPYLSMAASQLPRIPAAALGGFTGGAIKTAQDPNAEISDMLLSGLQSGGRMGAVEAGGVMAVPLLTKIMAPGLSSMTPESAQLAEWARAKKVPMSPSATAPSVTAKAVEGGSDAFLPSRLVNDAYRKKALQRFNELMTELPSEVGKVEGNQAITPKAMAELKAVFAASKAAGKETAGDFLEAIGPQTNVPVTNTRDTLARVMRTATDSKLRDWVTTKLTQLKGGKIPAEELEEALRQVGGIKPAADKKWLETIRSAIKADFQKAGAPMDVLAESNKAFSENYALVSSKAARKLSEQIARGEDPTSLTVSIFRAGNEGLITALNKEAAKEGGKLSKATWDSLRAQNLQNMIANASSESKRLMGLRVIDGAKLEKMLSSNKRVLDMAYQDRPDVLNAMSNLARLSRSASPDMRAFESGMGEMMKTGNISALLAGLYTEPVGTLMGSGSAMLAAKSMMNPNGTLNRWLTTGFDPTLPSEALRLGGRLAFQGDDEESQ